MFTHIFDQPPLATDATGPVGLVLAPTHELAKQIFAVATQTLTNTRTGSMALRGVALCGGSSTYAQKQALREGVEFAVATPVQCLFALCVHG